MSQEEQWAKLSKQMEDLQQETIRLAGELQRALEEQPMGIGDLADWQAWTKRWEQAETITAALRLGLTILSEEDSEEVKSLCRQLRRWRRLEGAPGVGWIEVRYVKGYGPYVYYRWRRPGERKIQTDYYGRIDRVQQRLVKDLWGDEGSATPL